MGTRKISRGQRNIDWIEKYCRIPEGRFVGKKVKLRPWQKKEIKKIFDNPHGTRTAILSFGRKNGKTALAAFLVLLFLAGPEAVQNTQLCSTALSRDQAALLFDLAAKVVRMSPELYSVIGVVDSRKQLFCDELGTRYRALSSDASTNLGGSPIFAVHDELGSNKGPRSLLYEAVETGMGAHEAPMSIIISTQSPEQDSLLSILIDDALGGHDPHTTVSLYTAPIDDDPFLVKTIRKANPAYGDFLNAEEVKKSAKDAKRIPSKESAFRNLILNQRVDADSVFVSVNLWKANSGAPDEDFGKARVFGGLDLSATNDLTALTLIAQIREKWHVHSFFWLPSEGLAQKAQNDRVPYDLWRDQGFLETTPGSSIQYEWIAARLRGIFDSYNVGTIGFDRWNWRFLEPWLKHVGFRDHEIEKFEPLGQGYQTMSPALREFETLLLAHKMRHGGHPVLNMCAANAVVQNDPAGNRKLAKDKSSGRIDGMVALTMAVACSQDDTGTGFVTGRLRTS